MTAVQVAAPVVDQMDSDVEAAAYRKLVNQRADRLVDAVHAAAAPLPDGRPLSVMLEQPDDEVAFVVDGLLPVGASVVLGAAYKAGKSTLVGNLIRSLVDGDDFLDAHPVAPSGGRRVALLDAELDERTLRRWLRDQGIRNADRVTVFSLRGRVAAFDIMTAAGQRVWADALAGHDVMIFDCLRPALDAVGLSEDKDAGRWLVAFDAVKAAAGIGEAVLVHHHGHSNDRSRGDSRILDWPDATWKLVREQGDDPSSRRYFSAFGRDVNVTESLLDIDPATRHLRLVGGSRADSKAGDALEPVVALIEGSLGGLSGNQVEQRMTEQHGDRYNRSAIRNALRVAEHTGRTVVSRGPRGANMHQIRTPLHPDFASPSEARGTVGSGR